MHHVTIYREPDGFGGWPANYGIWSWENEIVVGFTAGHIKEGVDDFHLRDRSRPFVAMQARSLDGGETWEVSETPVREPAHRRLSVDEHMDESLWVGQTLYETPFLQPAPGNIQFTHENFALMCARTGLRAGTRSWFYVSYDRCRSWEGPYELPMFGQSAIAARTDYVVTGEESCTLFVTAAKPNGAEGRVLCVRTEDAGKTFRFVSWVTPDPDGYTIMPATVRLPSGRLLTAVRCSGKRTEGGPRPPCWIDLYASDDGGASWRYLSRPVPDTGLGGNPPTLTLLQDGRLCITYGYRNAPFGMHAVLSAAETEADLGKEWSAPIVLRDDAGNHDIGYPRTIQRPDGQMVTVYYYNDSANGPRYIDATIWDPSQDR